ncbi:MAG: hypothetical protein Q3974_06990 [Rothia sp. (in: high G+C Gram-positive bacteria)]|nr:hypothetical protein [Rothia sp. (in: high G+C Gram-positive bacteria)]
MNFADLTEKVISVLLAGIVFGAGLPAFYALGMRMLAGTTEYTADGRLIETKGPSGAMKAIAYVIFAIILVIIVIAILWVAKDFLYHTFGFNLLGQAGKK